MPVRPTPFEEAPGPAAPNGQTIGEPWSGEILERIPDPVALLDREGRVAYVNPAAARGSGVSAAELVGRKVVEIGFAGAEFKPLWRDFGRVLAEREPITGELAATVASAIRTYAYTMTPLAGPGGEVAWVLITSRDVTSSTDAAAAHAESEAKYRNLVELAPDAILIHVDGVIAFANPAAAALFGAAGPEELVGRQVLDLVHPDMRERVAENIGMDLRGEESPLTMMDLVRADGTIITAQGRGAMISYLGRPAIQVVLRDVTDQIRAGAALRESEERLRFAQECAEIGTWDRDVTTGCVTVSSGFLEPYGLDATAIASYEDLVPFIHPDDRDQVEAGRRAAFAAGEPLVLEFRILAPSGETRWVQFKGRGVVDGEGTLSRVIGVMIDQTERRRAEEALRQREQTLAGILRAAPVGIGMVSHRVITEVNDQLCRMTGYAREELIGRDARIFYPSEETYARVGREKYAQILADGVGAVETQWRRKDGAVRDILLSSSPVDLANPYEDVVFNALDITRLRESERALESYMDDLQRSNEELQRFAYVASHDLQEPLRSIISFSQLLERRYKGRLDQDADEYIEFIVEGGNRMQRLIQDLLQLSRVETKAKPPLPTDAGEVVADALHMMEASIREAGATVTVGPMPRVMADAAQLVQVFSNLVANAIKYRRPGVPPAIRISAAREDGIWRFAVADNGIGIEPEYFDRIFVIFQRLHTRDEYEGTGIGLAVVRKIVERHGGRVRVESTPGEGSTFSFTIPAA